MEKSREERLMKTTAFSRNLKNLRDEKGLTTAEMANICVWSVSYMTSLFNGSRSPSSDVLCSIAAAFEGIDFQDVTYFLVNEENVKEDDRGIRYIYVWRMNNGRGPTAGVLKKVTEQDLIKKYSSEYQSNKFFYFLKRYIAEELYKGVYEEYIKNRMPDQGKSQAIKIETNPILKDIFELLYPMDDEDLLFIKEQAELYVKRIQQKRR